MGVPNSKLLWVREPSKIKKNTKIWMNFTFLSV